MLPPLPAGLCVRPPTVADAPAVLELVGAYNTSVVGFADYTLADVVDELSEPGFDAEHDAWLVAADGTLVGYGWSHRREGSAQVDIDVVALRDDVSEWLLDTAVTHAEELGRRSEPAQGPTIFCGVYRDDTTLAGALRRRGFEHATSYFRMRIEHHGPVAEPTFPADLDLVVVGADDHLRRLALGVQNEAFQDHFAHEDRSYDEWVASHDAQSTFDWSQLCVVLRDGAPVAMMSTNDQFVPDEDCGYVSRIGVLPAARGCGIATALLRGAFAHDAAAGRIGTLLHVDANNRTPALGLYESVGMRSDLVLDVWQRAPRG